MWIAFLVIAGCGGLFFLYLARSRAAPTKAQSQLDDADLEMRVRMRMDKWSDDESRYCP